jgi:mediator of RNA polymerase II transcription subunit 12, fungi type
VNVPAVLPEIFSLADDPLPEAPYSLEQDLRLKFSSSSRWAYIVWDNVIGGIKQAVARATDVTSRYACAARYGQFVIAVDKHILDDFNEHILQWFQNGGRQELETFSEEAWDTLACVLLNIAAHGTLSITTVLEGLIFPLWQAASEVSEAGVFLEAVNSLFNRLVIIDEVSRDGSSPANLLELQRLRALRSEIYQSAYFDTFVVCIPTLVVLSQNTSVSQKIRDSAIAIGQSICRNDLFREASYRNIDVVRSAFEKPLMTLAQDNRVCQPLISMLRLILGDSYQSERPP